MGEQHGACESFPLRVRVGKEAPDLTKRGCTEESIGDRMAGHIAVGVTEQAVGERDLNGPEPKRTSLDESMEIGPDPDAG